MLELPIQGLSHGTAALGNRTCRMRSLLWATGGAVPRHVTSNTTAITLQAIMLVHVRSAIIPPSRFTCSQSTHAASANHVRVLLRSLMSSRTFLLQPCKAHVLTNLSHS